MNKQNQYDTGIPIYLQIIQRIEQKIVSGTWDAGERVPPVRDLAMEFGVNPNTMQRSLSEMERTGLLHSERTTGRFITQDITLIASVRKSMAQDVIRDFQKQMVQMGYSKKQIVQLVENFEEETI